MWRGESRSDPSNVPAAQAEFVVALAVYEGMALITLTEPAVLALLRKFLSVSNKRTFYFHTERSSLEEIARLMRLDYLDVRLPEKDQRQRLLTELTYPGQPYYSSVPRQPSGRYVTMYGRFAVAGPQQIYRLDIGQFNA